MIASVRVVWFLLSFSFDESGMNWEHLDETFGHPR